MSSPSHAAIEGGDFSFQYGRYQEGGATKSQFRKKNNNIQVDSLEASGLINLTDQLTFQANFIQDTWGGATPITTGPAAAIRYNPDVETGASSFFDLKGGVINFNTKSGQGLATIPDTFQQIMTGETVHVMAVASPETRKQGDFKLNYDWDTAALALGGGISSEHDYESRYVSLSGRLDFNQKLTTLAWGWSYTNDTIDALRYRFRATSVPVDTKGAVNPDYPDWSVKANKSRTANTVNFSLTQVLDKNSLLTAGFVYAHDSGYLSNPYKEATFLIPLDTPGTAWLYTRYDKRPEERNQFTWSAGYSHYIEGLDAALKFNYSFFHDNWGINAHTFDASWGQSLGHGWVLTPKVRYYSQDAADFYSPYFVPSQTPRSITDVLAHQSELPMPEHFSSDHRLSGFGAVSGGIMVSKQFTKGVNLEAGFEYYTHVGALKLGGGGTSDFADFSAFMANARLRVNLSALGRGGHQMMGHMQHAGGHHDYAPAGVMLSHMLNAGEFMVGYHYMYSRKVGDMLHGTQKVADPTIVHNACGDFPCGLTTAYMNMNMHMLDIMYAPTDWLNLMLMPQFMDMDMQLRQLAGAPPPDPEANGGHNHGSGPARHETGGVGDTQAFALIRLFDSPFPSLDSPNHHLHLGLGVSAPTGTVSIKVQGQETNRNKPDYGQPLFLHYGMQLGSGTWDFLPSLTYTGVLDRWSWGGQLSGIVRMESRNASGYALGNEFQATAWGGYSLLNWLSASVRGIYTAQGKIRGHFNGPHPTSNSAPVDWPQNYGGRYLDVGFGLNASVSSGMLKGNQVSVELVQPVQDDVNGYQVERQRILYASWSYMF